MSERKPRPRRLLCGVALLSLALPVSAAVSATGCSGGGYGLCDRACDCEGCSDAELQSCYDFYEDSALDADQADCGAEYDALIACAHDAFECVGGRVDYGNSCFGETAELAECFTN